MGLGTAASAVMKMGCFPLGSVTRPYRSPGDDLTKEVSRLLTTPSGLRDMFAENTYVAPEGTIHQQSDLIRALPVCVEADKIATAEALRDVLIQVDVFENLTDAEGKEGYVRPPLEGTEERMASLDRKRFA